MAFSATDAAFEGFRVVRRHPMALVFWSLFYILVMVAAFAAMGPSIVSFVAATEALEQSGATATMADFQPIFQMMGTLVVILLPLSLISSAMLYAAVARSVVRPGESSFGYLRLGMDEVRVLVVSLVLFLFFTVVAVVIFGGIGALAGMATAGDMPILWLVVFLLGLAAVLLFIWLAVRLSLAIPITMAERRMAIFDSFGVTKGRFWPLLGMALLAFVMTIVVGLLGSLVTMPLQFLTGGMTDFGDLEGADLQVILQTAWPAIAVYVVVNAILSALQLAVLYAPFSAAYRDIKGGQPNAAVFD